MSDEQPSPGNWICDLCGQEIPDPKVGLVTWRYTDSRPMYDFMIVHKGMDPWHCWQRAERDGYRSTWELDACLGVDGMAVLLTWLSEGPADSRTEAHDVAPEDLYDYVDLFRRLQMPFYEQARRKFRYQAAREELAGANELYPYVLDTLRGIAGLPEE